ncbi:sigma 54-interacting transcriptional regulator [Brevibacillus massiliensis]|uniref:sigma 54-interacting transcriptional regulator n=1 Tax=Brevibacillus massiliensis TaxID=1118054 RepID=UPI0002E7FA94|nr:sigma 54-interacting transcriptional regulator [Brevibacillus massiliensis]
MVSKWFVREAYTVTMESTGNDVWKIMSEYNEPYVFITEREHGRVVAFIRNTDMMPSISDKEWMSRPAGQLPFRTNLMSIQREADMLDFIKVLGEEVVVILNRDGQLAGYLQREDILYYLLTNQSSHTDWIRSLLNSIPMGIIVADTHGRIENFSSEVLRMIRLSPEELRRQRIGDIFDQEIFEKVTGHGEVILNHIIVNERIGVLADFGPIRNKHGSVTGAIIVLQDLPYIENMAMELEYVKNLNKDLQAILSSIYDEILVVDGNGVLLRYSGNLIKDFWEIEKEQLIGINLMELEHEGTFFAAIVKMVLERKRKVSVTQESRSGKNVLAVGNPVFDEKGKLERIVIALRDITETVLLKEELRHAKKMSERYKKELENLRDQKHYVRDRQVIYGSGKIEKVMKYIQKVANVASTVLLTGESGVGKEVFARAIHEIGARHNKPFIKVNCGAIPEALLESELFGYEKGAFTGANANGKIGYFQMANKGILFLDEIAEMPLSLQVKLLRVLQEREIIPVGGTKVEEVDVQIIAATNKNLEKMVEQGSFREDLYYRLNVIPIHIPPLRERPEDIPLLSLYFLQKFNEKYGRKNQLSQDALDVLESYSWPGNVRELQNIIERLSVTSDEDLIDSYQITPLLKKGKKTHVPRNLHKIVSLKEAMKALEEQLITMAMEEYKTTSLAAKALGVSQSTISRKYQAIQWKRERGDETGDSL